MVCQRLSRIGRKHIFQERRCIDHQDYDSVKRRADNLLSRLNSSISQQTPKSLIHRYIHRSCVPKVPNNLSLLDDLANKVLAIHRIALLDPKRTNLSRVRCRDDHFLYT